MLIPFDELFARHNVNVRGVLHVGAHYGQELPMYNRLGLSHITFVEADPDTYKVLLENVRQQLNVSCINACVSDEDGQKVKFHRTNNQGQSSSILELGTHATVHPDVVVTEDIELTTVTLENIIKATMSQQEIEEGSLDFLNMDLQGAELKALKGMGDYLSKVKVAYLEVNKQELYKGCGLVEDIDMYMAPFGFQRVETKWQGNFGWGDALYVKTV